MPGRGVVGSAGYRYGFNGKEDDQEMVASGDGTQDYGMRIYNPSLGKFLSVDPLTAKYPELTPYQFASNRPIDGFDEDGLEFRKYLTPEEVGQRLGNLKGRPQLINQGMGNTCAIAAINYLWIKSNFSSYSDAVMHLYSSGEATNNGFLIKPHEITENLDPHTQNSSHYKTPNGMLFPRGSQSVDWMMITSIQNSVSPDFFGLTKNLDYKPHNTYLTIQSLMKNLLGFTNIATEGQKASVFQTVFEAKKRLDEGYLEIWGVNSDFLSNRTTFALSINGENHAVALMNISYRYENGQFLYNFTVQTWGEDKEMKDVTETEFKSFFYHTTYGKPKK